MWLQLAASLPLRPVLESHPAAPRSVRRPGALVLSRRFKGPGLRLELCFRILVLEAHLTSDSL